MFIIIIISFVDFDVECVDKVDIGAINDEDDDEDEEVDVEHIRMSGAEGLGCISDCEAVLAELMA